MKPAYELKHVKSVTAVALLENGKEAGKIIANWSDNRNGSVCTATVILYNSYAGYVIGTGRAGGYGYDKYSSAVYCALSRMREYQNETPIDMTGDIRVKAGHGNVREAFEHRGYQYIEIIS